MKKPASDQSKEMVMSFRSGLATQINGSVIYLNSTVNWALTLILAALASLTIASSPSAHVLGVFFSALLVVVLHFFVRACKAYINVIRFSLLDRETLALIEVENFHDAAQIIRDYYCDWQSPLALSQVVSKVLFELGFLYFFAIVVGQVVFITLFQGAPIYLPLAAIAFSLVEIYFGLYLSPYFRTVKVNKLAQRTK